MPLNYCCLMLLLQSSVEENYKKHMSLTAEEPISHGGRDWIRTLWHDKSGCIIRFIRAYNCHLFVASSSCVLLVERSREVRAWWFYELFRHQSLLLVYLLTSFYSSHQNMVVLMAVRADRDVPITKEWSDRPLSCQFVPLRKRLALWDAL